MLIVYSGLIGQTGTGGAAWVDMQYLIGLKALGHDVYYLEDIGEGWVYSRELDRSSNEVDHLAKFVEKCFSSVGFEVPWIVRSVNASCGLAEDDFIDICSRADLLILCAAPLWLWRDEYDRPTRKIFIDIDPGFSQIRLESQNKALKAALDRCDRVFTIAQRIGAEDCEIPEAGYKWCNTIPPVALSHWPPASHPSPTQFTSILNWGGPFENIRYNGKVYGNRDIEFPKFIDLPQKTSQSFQLAILGVNGEELRKNGWDVVPAASISKDPVTYRDFIQTSRGEFLVAKHGYVEMRGGWFSDRSVCYLASGRPVVMEDTGLEDWLPVGEGILAFKTLEEAAEAIDRVNADYERHCRAARSLAEEFFSADRVLGRLIEIASS